MHIYTDLKPTRLGFFVFAVMRVLYRILYLVSVSSIHRGKLIHWPQRIVEVINAHVTSRDNFHRYYIARNYEFREFTYKQ
jgi:hypothetical protein